MRTPLNFSKPPAITSLDKAGPRVVCPTRHWREGRRRERGRRRNRLIPPVSVSSPLAIAHRPHPPAQARGRRCRLVFGDGVERFHQDQELYRFRGVWCRSVERAGPGTLPREYTHSFPIPRFLEFLGAVLVRLARFFCIYCRFGQICRVEFGGILDGVLFSIDSSWFTLATGISPEMRVCRSRNLSEKR